MDDLRALDMKALDHEMIGVSPDQMAAGKQAITVCGTLQCITTFFGRPEDLSPGQRADRVVASGIRVHGAVTSSLKPIFRWPHICELAKAMGYHSLHLSGVSREHDITLFANSVIKTQAVNVGCQAWVIMNGADKMSDNVNRSEMLLAHARRLCRDTPTKDVVTGPGPPLRKGIRNLTLWLRMRPYPLPCIRNESAADTNRRIDQLLTKIARDHGHSKAGQHLLEGLGFTGTVVQNRTIASQPLLDNKKAAAWFRRPHISCVPPGKT